MHTPHKMVKKADSTHLRKIYRNIKFAMSFSANPNDWVMIPNRAFVLNAFEKLMDPKLRHEVTNG